MADLGSPRRLREPEGVEQFLRGLEQAERLLGKKKKARVPPPEMPPLRLHPDAPEAEAEPEAAAREPERMTLAEAMAELSRCQAEIERLQRQLKRQQEAGRAMAEAQRRRIAELERTELQRALRGSAARDGVVLAEILGAPRALKRSVR